MGAQKGGSAGGNKGKKAHKNKPTSKKYSYYTTSGDTLKRNKKFCVKCGPGVFLSVHKDRLHCGKCHYTEFLAK